MDVNNAKTAVYPTIDSNSQTNKSNGELDQDAFFQILSAQLQYQDPLAGGDHTEYVAQMAQFASLEQMQNLNTNFENMIQRQDLMYANDLVGQSVIFSEGDDLFQGIIEAYGITSNEPYFVVGEKEFKISQIKGIVDNIDSGEVETTPEESANNE